MKTLIANKAIRTHIEENVIVKLVTKYWVKTHIQMAQMTGVRRSRFKGTLTPSSNHEQTQHIFKKLKDQPFSDDCNCFVTKKRFFR